MKLMIVDDHAGMRKMVRQFAAAAGDVVRECADGREAVQAAGEFAPDCVTMDLKLPGLDGLAATRGIVALQPATRIIIVSAYDQPELRRAAAEAGAAGFVAKDNLGELKGQLRPGQKPAAGTPAAATPGGR
jgi:DNA-binding NarL/FixJ family response regulator